VSFGFLIKVLIFALIAGAVFLGARRIWRDWRGHAKKLDDADRRRDLAERGRPDVISLKRDKDGKFRPD
jgi:hypothetical protein